MFMSVTMSRVGQKIQNVSIKISSLLSNSAIVNGEIFACHKFYKKMGDRLLKKLMDRKMGVQNIE